MRATTPISADGAPSGRLTIDLGAVRENWRRLDLRASGAETGAVVKADAYGLGLASIAPALWLGGARRFYVARTEEGAAARALLPDAAIVTMAPVLPEEL
ncbi:MAG: alanine racemase, partial [Alphaproteobacteria bacterium]